MTEDSTVKKPSDLSQDARMSVAAESYRQAMLTKESRDLWIEKYLPLVKSIVVRLRNRRYVWGRCAFSYPCG